MIMMMSIIMTVVSVVIMAAMRQQLLGINIMTKAWLVVALLLQAVLLQVRCTMMPAGTAHSVRQGFLLQSRRSCLGPELAALGLPVPLAVQGFRLQAEVVVVLVVVVAAAHLATVAWVSALVLAWLRVALPSLRLVGAALWSLTRYLAQWL